MSGREPVSSLAASRATIKVSGPLFRFGLFEEVANTWQTCSPLNVTYIKNRCLQGNSMVGL